jgi:hypothetical protein
MYGSAPFGAAPFGGEVHVTSGGGPLPEPTGGGNFMLLGVRSLWWALLLLPVLS